MLGASFEPNHGVAMKQCNTVDSPSSRSAVGGKSEKKTQRLIDSFRVLLPPTMTVKDETSDGLTSTTEETPTTRQQEETNIEPQLNDGAGRTKLPTRLAPFGLGFPHTRRCPFASPRDSLGSRCMSSEASRFHGLISGGGCITLKTKTR